MPPSRPRRIDRAVTGFSLHPIERNGSVPGHAEPFAEPASGVIRQTVDLYSRAAFEPPWIGYLAFLDRMVVGTCAFTSPPRNGIVEIAYFTFPGFENRGLATAMAAELVAIACRRDPAVVITAHTLPARNASHRVLEKTGFHLADTLDHPEDGLVNRWRLATPADPGRELRQ